MQHLEVSMAIIAAALIFGFAHLANGAKSWKPSECNWELARTTFLAGIPLGLLYAVTGSLLLPTILHAILLALSMIFTPDAAPQK